MNAFRIAAAAALLTTSAAAAAQTATDAGCILVSNAFAKNAKEADAKKLAEASLYFYLGRIGDRTTAAQLRTLLETQSKTITEASATAMMNACAKAFQSKVEMVQSLSPQKAQPPQGR